MRLIDADALIKEACAEGAYGYVDAARAAREYAIRRYTRQQMLDFVTIGGKGRWHLK